MKETEVELLGRLELDRYTGGCVLKLVDARPPVAGDGTAPPSPAVMFLLIWEQNKLLLQKKGSEK